MDLSKLWDGAGDLDEGGGVEDGQRRDKRQYTYKRKGINFTSTTKDNRTLRSMKVTERRKGSRESMHSAGRVIDDAEHLDMLDEKDENQDSVFDTKSSPKSKISDVQKKSRIRREKLNEYLDQKKKLEDLKRKMAKPAFKVGIVHHPAAPTSGVDTTARPNLFSTTLNTSKVAPRLSKAKSSNHTIRRTKSDLTGERSKAFVFSVKDINKDLSTLPKTKLVSVVEDQIPDSLTKEVSPDSKTATSDLYKGLSLVPVSKVEENFPDVQNHDPYLPTIAEDVTEDVHEVVIDQLSDLEEQETKDNDASSEIMQFDHLTITNSSCSTKNTIGFTKSREAFIWFVKKATLDRRSYAHTELYHWLLKMFAESDINKEGLVRKASFIKMFDMAVSIRRMYGYAPVESELYETEQEKEQAMENMFNSMDIGGTGVITFNEWYQFSVKHILAKTATLYPHPIFDASDKQQLMTFIKAVLVPGSKENTELYRFLVEVFAEHDADKDGVITIKEFPAMIYELMEIPKKVLIAHPDMVSDY